MTKHDRQYITWSTLHSSDSLLVFWLVEEELTSIGGWVMNDEANAHYEAVINQVEQGWNESQFGVAVDRRPHVSPQSV
jgi:hypothetical protein